MADSIEQSMLINDLCELAIDVHSGSRAWLPALWFCSVLKAMCGIRIMKAHVEGCSPESVSQQESFQGQQ